VRKIAEGSELTPIVFDGRYTITEARAGKAPGIGLAPVWHRTQKAAKEAYTDRLRNDAAIDAANPAKWNAAVRDGFRLIRVDRASRRIREQTLRRDWHLLAKAETDGELEDLLADLRDDPNVLEA